MLKMRIFGKKTVKIVSASVPFASGGCELRPQTSAFIHPPTITTLWSSILALNAFYTFKK